MPLTKGEIEETLSTLGVRKGESIFVYNEHGRDITAEVCKILSESSTDNDSTRSFGHLFKKYRLEGNWRQLLGTVLRCILRR